MYITILDTILFFQFVRFVSHHSNRKMNERKYQAFYENYIHAKVHAAAEHFIDGLCNMSCLDPGIRTTFVLDFFPPRFISFDLSLA